MSIQEELYKAFDDSIPAMSDELDKKHVIRPDEAWQDQKLNMIKSGMDLLYESVMKKMKYSRVYVHFKMDVSRFCADFFIVTTIGNNFHTGQYATSWLAIGMDNEQVERECGIICKALANSLGQRIFIDDAPTIQKGALLITDILKEFTE